MSKDTEKPFIQIEALAKKQEHLLAANRRIKALISGIPEVIDAIRKPITTPVELPLNFPPKYNPFDQKVNPTLYDKHLAISRVFRLSDPKIQEKLSDSVKINSKKVAENRSYINQLTGEIDQFSLPDGTLLKGETAIALNRFHPFSIENIVSEQELALIVYPGKSFRDVELQTRALIFNLRFLINKFGWKTKVLATDYDYKTRGNNESHYMVSEDEITDEVTVDLSKAKVSPGEEEIINKIVKEASSQIIGTTEAPPMPYIEEHPGKLKYSFKVRQKDVDIVWELLTSDDLQTMDPILLKSALKKIRKLIDANGNSNRKVILETADAEELLNYLRNKENLECLVSRLDEFYNKNITGSETLELAALGEDLSLKTSAEFKKLRQERMKEEILSKIPNIKDLIKGWISSMKFLPNNNSLTLDQVAVIFETTQIKKSFLRKLQIAGVISPDKDKKDHHPRFNLKELFIAKWFYDSSIPIAYKNVYLQHYEHVLDEILDESGFLS